MMVLLSDTGYYSYIVGDGQVTIRKILRIRNQSITSSDQQALGARGHLSKGDIEVTLRFFKQFIHTLSKGYMVESFAMYPPL